MTWLESLGNVKACYEKAWTMSLKSRGWAGHRKRSESFIYRCSSRNVKDVFPFSQLVVQVTFLEQRRKSAWEGLCVSLAANTYQLINDSSLTIDRGTYIHSPDLSGKASAQWVGDENGGHMKIIFLTVPMFVFISSQGWGLLARSIPDSRLLRSIL